MPKYRVKCEPTWEYLYIEVEAENEDEAMSMAEDKFADGEFEFSDDVDMSACDTCTAVEAEELPDNNPSDEVT